MQRTYDVVVLYDLATKQWDVKTLDVLHYYYMDFAVGFRNEGQKTVSFRNLRFDVTLTDVVTDQVVFTQSHPISNIVYVRSNQDVLLSMRINVVPGQYKARVHVINADEDGVNEFELTSPRPPQPFPSWHWDSEQNRWCAPVPYPDDTSLPYRWNESTGEWENIPMVSM